MSIKNIFSYALLILSMSIFFAFGLFHLGQFETTDEHFWKFDRIQKYYNGIAQGVTQGEWKKTRINDKPGVTVAWLSGMGLPFAQVHPESLRDENREKLLRETHGGIATSAFHAQDTAQTNFALRLPIVLFSAIMLSVLYWLLAAFVRVPWMAAIIVAAIALSSVLVGMSRVINPDAVLWSTMSGALVASWVFVRHGGRRFLVTALVLTGLALLSKYTASLLFVLFPLVLVLFVLWYKGTDYATFVQWYRLRVAGLVTIVLGGCTLFALGMPAVFQRPEHFLYGTFLSPALAPIAIAVVLLYGALIIDAFTVRGRMAWWCARSSMLHLCGNGVRKMLAVLLLVIAVLSVVNAYKAEPWLPLGDIKEVGRDGGALTFPQIVFTDGPLHEFFVLVAQSQNMFFALPSAMFVLFIIALGYFVYAKNLRYVPELTFILLTIFVFLAGGIVADVFVNVRYGIVLYPLMTIFTGLVLWQMCAPYWKIHANMIRSVIAIVLLSLVWELSVARPFYLTYENIFLPQQYFITDAWGYGFYEAATWLNAQPDAHNMAVWSDDGGDLLCQFFVGSCLRPQKIDTSKVIPDYIILTRRRSIIRPLQLTNTKSLDASELIAQKPVWQLNMNNRPDNYIKIIKVHQ